MSIIDKIDNKIKYLGSLKWMDAILLPWVILSFSVLAFCFGFLYAKSLFQDVDNEVMFIYQDDNIKDHWFDKSNNENSLDFFASKNGTNFYNRSCKAGNRIKDANKIYFETKNEATLSGYSFSKSCR